MDPATNPSATRRLGAPPNWDPQVHGPCGALEIADVIDQSSGGHVMESLWRPSAEELEALANGGLVILGIFGTEHPVVYVGVSVPPQHDLPPDGQR